MILLERKEPTSIAYYTSLIRRAAPNPDYEERLRRAQAGYAGELFVDREWLEAVIPCSYFLLHDFEFRNSAGFSHQVDTLFLSPHFALVVEIKNINGQLRWDTTTHQFTRTTKDGVIDGFRNPIHQAERHVRHLQKLFEKIRLPLPIEYVVVLAHPNSIIAHNTTLPIIHTSGIHYYLADLLSKYPAIIEFPDLKRAAMKMKKIHAPSPMTIKLNPNQLEKGVLCPKCPYPMRMNYHHRKWQCPRCHEINNEAFYVALQDYRILVNETISNKEFRDFFEIESANVAYTLLQKLNLQQIGTFKDKRYIIPSSLYGYSL